MKVKNKSNIRRTRVRTRKLKEAAIADEATNSAMVRTQIYLSKEEHDFVQPEAARQGAHGSGHPGFIDEKMEIPEDAWRNNPMLSPGRMIPTGKDTKTAGSTTIIIFMAARRNGLKSKANRLRLRLCRRTITKSRQPDAYDKIARIGRDKMMATLFLILRFGSLS